MDRKETVLTDHVNDANRRQEEDDYDGHEAKHLTSQRILTSIIRFCFSRNKAYSPTQQSRENQHDVIRLLNGES